MKAYFLNKIKLLRHKSIKDCLDYIDFKEIESVESASGIDNSNDKMCPYFIIKLSKDKGGRYSYIYKSKDDFIHDGNIIEDMLIKKIDNQFKHEKVENTCLSVVQFKKVQELGNLGIRDLLEDKGFKKIQHIDTVMRLYVRETDSIVYSHIKIMIENGVLSDQEYIFYYEDNIDFNKDKLTLEGIFYSVKDD